MLDSEHTLPISADVTSTMARAFAANALACFAVFVALLALFGVPLLPVALLIGTALFLYLVFRFPLIGLGIFLVLIPVYPLAFLVAKFFGPSYVGLLEGGDRVMVLLLGFVLWKRNGIKLILPDYLLLACFGLASARLLISGSLIALLSDFNFVLPYFAGRVTILTLTQERVWAKRAVWIVAFLAVLGMVEVFYVGEGPRTALYLAVAQGGTEGGALDAAFHGENYFGLRESSTMFGPLQFAPLCMVALLIWWVYFRNPVSGGMIAAGLICSVTRSAWVGAAVAISILAILRGEKKRLAQYGALALLLFLISIPVLGLGDYLFSMKAGEDPSAQGHRESMLTGLQYVLQHPWGEGPGNVGKWAIKEEATAIGIESSYLTLAAEYGIPALLCFLGFLISAFRIALRQRTEPAYIAMGIIVGFGMVMTFAALHDVFALACWLWFPVGLVIRSASKVNGEVAAAAELQLQGL
jgi:hypothetical protein